MEAASRRRQLGPFAVYDVFPLNASEEPITVHNLALRNHMKGQWAGFDSLEEIRGTAEEKRGRAVNNVDNRNYHLLQWRAVVSINHQSHNTASTVLPPLSSHGTHLVRATAASNGKPLESSFKIIVQGLTRSYSWDDTSTPPSLIVYSEDQDYGHTYKLRAAAVAAQTVDASLAEGCLLAHPVLAWLRQHKTIHQDTALDSVLTGYKEALPRQRAYDERDDPYNAQTHRNHIRTTLLSVTSVEKYRRAIKEERLIEKRDYIAFQHEIVALRDRDFAHRARDRTLAQSNIMSAPQPGTSTTATAEPSTTITTTPIIDDLLERTPLWLFDQPDLPLPGQRPWQCPFEGCPYTRAPSDAKAPYHPGTQSYDREALRFRQAVAKHLSKHLSSSSQDPEATIPISDLYTVSRSLM